jgi:O-antigen ligase
MSASNVTDQPPPNLIAPQEAAPTRPADPSGDKDAAIVPGLRATVAAPGPVSDLDRIAGGIGPSRLRLALGIAVTSTTVLFGSADDLPLALNGLLLFVLAAATLVLFPMPARFVRLAAAAGALAFVLAGWALIQTLPLPLSLAHPVWSVAEAEIGLGGGALSVDPAQTTAAIIPLLIPFAVFLATLALATDDAAAVSVLRFHAIAGGVIAVFAILQFELAPGTLIAIEKTAYLDSLTGPFVNRNTAATYFSMIALLACGLGVASLPATGDAERAGLLAGADPRLFWGSIALVALVAVGLTNSRAGLAAGVAGFVVAAALMIAGPGAGGRASGRFGPAEGERPHNRVVLAIGAVVVIVVAAAFVGGRSLFRLDVAGLADNRFCILPRTLDLAADNWLTGTGLGTFETAYVAYRDPVCGIYGAWDSAHNVYLDAFVTLGIVAVPATVAILGVLLSVLWKGLSRRRRLRALPAVGLGIVTLTALHALFDFSIEIAGFSAPFAAIVGAIVATAATRSRSAGIAPR